MMACWSRVISSRRVRHGGQRGVLPVSSAKTSTFDRVEGRADVIQAAGFISKPHIRLIRTVPNFASVDEAGQVVAHPVRHLHFEQDGGEIRLEQRMQGLLGALHHDQLIVVRVSRTLSRTTRFFGQSPTIRRGMGVFTGCVCSDIGFVFGS